jgi:hypothetical protein
MDTRDYRARGVEYMADVWTRATPKSIMDPKIIIEANSRTYDDRPGFVELQCGIGVVRVFNLSYPGAQETFTNMRDQAERTDLPATELLTGKVEEALSSKQEGNLGFLVTRAVPRDPKFKF